MSTPVEIAATAGAPRRAHRARRLSGWLALIVLIAGTVLFSSAMELFWTRIDQHRFPWAYTRSGRPTLTGTWVGALTTGRGARRGLYLDLQLEPLRFGRGRRGGAYRHAGSDKLAGELRICGGANGVQRFELHGNNVSDDASRFRLGFRVPEGTAPADGLAPSFLRGMWNGRDSLLVEADLYLRRGAAAITSTADGETGPPQPGALHRADPREFSTICNRIASKQ